MGFFICMVQLEIKRRNVLKKWCITLDDIWNLWVILFILSNYVYGTSSPRYTCLLFEENRYLKSMVERGPCDCLTFKN